MDEHIFEQLRRGIEYYQRIRNSYRREASRLRRVGGYKLSTKEYKGTLYYTVVWTKDGVTRRRYLGKAESYTLQQIQRKYYFNEAVKAIDGNLNAMQQCLERMRSIDPEAMLPGFPRAYRCGDRSVYGVDNNMTEDGKDWERRQPMEDFWDDGKIYRTNRGELVRSKTELVIANELASRGISNVYETVRFINGKRVRPDFVIYYHGKEYIWEHFGMMDDPDYFAENVEKLINYLNGGYYPNYNFITTFEQEGRELDSIFIGRIIDLWFGDDRRPGIAAA
ncbi:MAG: hypothetical protein IJH91_01975 [Mogibacterium sp.]|nr:hypothetical protein [Mogibacterium sp.]